MDRYEVIVGNIGTVHRGNNLMVACAKFQSHKKDSKANYGRAAGEPVTLMDRGEPKLEYAGTLSRE